MKILIERYPSEELQTLGELYVLGKYNQSIYSCVTLELPWLDNRKYFSCIPEGTYVAEKHTSPKFDKSFWIKNVPNRSEILIHKGNYYYDIKGCIIPGRNFTDINNDNFLDVTYSTDTIKDLYRILPDKFEIIIEGR